MRVHFSRSSLAVRPAINGGSELFRLDRSSMREREITSHSPLCAQTHEDIYTVRRADKRVD